MINYFESEPMKYYAPPATMDKETRKTRLEMMAESGDYLYGEKYDGNWSRAVITPERNVLQTRGISVKTKTYGEVQDKVLFWNNVVEAFPDTTTVILGEIYRDGDIDRDIGSVLRCLRDKAITRQKNNPLHWRIFDVLCYEGQDLMNTPFEERIKYIPVVVKKINSPLVQGVEYKPMTPKFFEEIEDIFSKGGEGAVCYKRTALYEPGKRGPHSWDSVKVKQEISNDIDCFITGVEAPTQSYNGKELEKWTYWIDIRTGEKKLGEYFGEYQIGKNLQPITKNYYYGWPGAIYVGVYDNQNEIYPLCKVAGLTEEFKTELRDHFDDWYMCPVTIGGMMLSEAQGLSVRHPYLKSIRKGDIDAKDCTLRKILS